MIISQRKNIHMLLIQKYDKQIHKLFNEINTDKIPEQTTHLYRLRNIR